MTRTIISLTKENLLDLIEREFPETSRTKTIATLISCGEDEDGPQQQCLVFSKELLSVLV